jgi:hypothetical protein
MAQLWILSRQTPKWKPGNDEDACVKTPRRRELVELDQRLAL